MPALFSAAAAPRFSSAAGHGARGRQRELPERHRDRPARTRPTATPSTRPTRATSSPASGSPGTCRARARTVVRGGYGIYYDQPLVGHLPAERVREPAARVEPVRCRTRSCRTRVPAPAPPRSRRSRSSPPRDPFDTPRTQQWNVGVQRQLYSRGVIDVGYVGSAGDNLIQPVDINQPQPQDVVAPAAPSTRRVRTRASPASTCRQTTAKARYHGLLMGFRHDAGRAGTLSIAYTLVADEDGCDQRPRRPRPPAEPARPGGRVRDRAHRPHARLHRQLGLRAAVLQGLGRSREGRAGRLAGVRHRAVLVRPADLARRQRHHQRQPARHPGQPGGRSLRQPAGEPHGRRLLVQPGGVRAAGRRPATATPGARSSACPA